MRHDWVINVLTDLQSYAEKNDLPATAKAAKQALDVAMDELAAQSDLQDGDSPTRLRRPN